MSDVDHQEPWDKVIFPTSNSTNNSVPVEVTQLPELKLNRSPHERVRSASADRVQLSGSILEGNRDQIPRIHHASVELTDSSGVRLDYHSLESNDMNRPNPQLPNHISAQITSFPDGGRYHTNFTKPTTAEESMNEWGVNRLNSKSEGPVESYVFSQTTLRRESRKDRCRRQCAHCMRRLRLPKWLTNPLLTVYRVTGGALTYVLFLLVIYTTSYALQPTVAMPPICRRVAIPSLKASLQRSNTTDTSTLPIGTDSPVGYDIGLECRRGEAMSVLIFYGFGFLCGELMEMIHLPGLLGMLLGGMALRNIGIAIIPETIYHEGYLPNGSYPMESSFTVAIDSGAPVIDDTMFDIRDSRTQLAALLTVNPSLSAILRQLALTTILSRAGLGLDPVALKQVCGSVFRLAFVPCICEAISLMIVTRFLIGWPWVWGAILGFVCAAVSPAVIVPNMMRLEVTGWGVAEGIPTLVVAAASLDDVIAITGFGVALAVGLSTGESLVTTLIWGPVEALIGAAFGASVGMLLCLFPPPKLEHSHLLRGILLVCMAITGLVGSIVLHLPGAGALACLTLAFFVALGWRAGFPWRLTQFEEPLAPAEESFVPTNNILSDDSETRGSSLFPSPSTTTNQPDDQSDISAHRQAPKSKSNVIPFIRITEADKKTVTNVDNESDTVEGGHMVRQSNRGSDVSSILEALVEYHPYYCSILRQQYRNSHISSQGSSVRSSVSKRALKMVPGGDLPAIAVAVAATGTDPRSSQGNVAPHVSLRSRSRASRRFSLPEPTAYYELESFSLIGTSRYGFSSSSANSGAVNLAKTRRRILSPTFREQYEAIYNQPVDKLEEIEESECDQQEKPGTTVDSEQLVDQNASAHEPDTGAGSVTPPAILIQATPQQRGLVCVNSMRQTLAAVWWFVQPILFSLIGSEVNLTHMSGKATGRGIASLLIALLFRLCATVLAVMPSKMNMKERLFVGFSWLPKATVQAAVGPVALDTARKLNAPLEIIEYGEQILMLAALAILLSAPLGAILMPFTAPYLLHQDLSSTEIMVSRTRRTDESKKNSKSMDKSPSFTLTQGSLVKVNQTHSTPNPSQKSS